MDPQYDPYNELPNLGYDWSGPLLPDDPSVELVPPQTVPGDGSNYTNAGYEQVAWNQVASDIATYGSGSLAPLPVHPSGFDSQLPMGAAAPLPAEAAAQLGLDTYLNYPNMPSVPDVPLPSRGTTYLTAQHSTGMLNEQLQQLDVSVHDHPVGQSVAPNGGDQHLMGRSPYHNTTVFSPQPVGVHPGFVDHDLFNVQEFQKDVANLNSVNGSLRTGLNMHPRAAVPSAKRQHKRPVWPAPLSYPRERPVRYSPIHQPRTLTPRLRAIAKYWPHRVPESVEANGFVDPPEPSPSLNPLPSALPAPPAGAPLKPANSLWGLTNAQPPMVRSTPVDPLPTSIPSAPEPAAPAMAPEPAAPAMAPEPAVPAVPAVTPVQVFGHLSKDRWNFFRISQVVRDQVTGGPRGKQVDACQYIDPTTKMKCYQSKCHGSDGEPLRGKGFPIKDLENYVRHLWLHRKVERMLFRNVDAADIMTLWNDALLDAQKALDDAKGIVYPYGP